MATSLEPGAMSTIVGSLSVTALQLIAALLITGRLVRSHNLSRTDGFIVLWLIWDAMVHLMIVRIFSFFFSLKFFAPCCLPPS